MVCKHVHKLGLFSWSVADLAMNDCGLEAWPANLSGDSFPVLEGLDLMGNDGLKEMPEGLAPFSCLTWLNVASSDLSILPQSLARVCPLLEWLDMSNCRSWVISEGVRDLKHLKV